MTDYDLLKLYAALFLALPAMGLVAALCLYVRFIEREDPDHPMAERVR